jgi:hypothetical protein
MPKQGTKRSRSVDDALESTVLSDIIVKCVAYVKSALEGNDASHDWRHIERVGVFISLL